MSAPAAAPRPSVNSRARLFLFAGLTILLTGLVVTGINGAFSIVSSTLSVIGILVGAVAFLPRVTRSLTLYLNVALYSLFFIGTVLVLLLVVARHPFTFDATRQKLHSLSPITQDFIKRLDRPVRVTAFLTRANRDQGAQVFREYQRHSPQFTYRVYDPINDVTVARQYGVTVMPGDIFVESLTTDTRAVERSIRVQGLQEERITNAIVQTLRGEQLIVYFLTGHGEPGIESARASDLLAGRTPRSDDLTWLAAQLQESHIIARPLALTRTASVPEDASAVVCVAPRSDLSGAEQAALRAYLDSGGKAFFLLGPSVAATGMPLRNFAALLSEYAIDLPERVVVLTQGSNDRFTVPARALPHTVTQAESDTPIDLVQARPVMKSQLPRPDATVDFLLESPDGAWGVPIEQINEALIARKPLSMTVDPKELGRIPIAAAVSVVRPGTSIEDATRIVVVGNGNFLFTNVITQEGWLLFQNGLNWLTSTSDLIAIPSASVENTPLVLTPGQSQFLFLLLVIIIPMLVGLSGLAYSITRRELV